MKDQKGFSLIELLIVVVIIGIIAAVAIPNLLASRRAANEGNAISTLRTYHGAQMTYQATAGAGDYAGSPGMQSFGVLANANLLDGRFIPASPEVNSVRSGFYFGGYSVQSTGGNPACFLGYAHPVDSVSVAATGKRSFVINTEGVLHNAEDSFQPYIDITGCEVNTGAYSPLSQ